jgi:hypothetical protein
MPGFPPSDALSVKKKIASASMQPISRREIRCSCNTLLPSILRSPTGICPSAAVIPLRCAPRLADFSIISRSSATPRKAEQEGATIIVRGEGVHDLGYCRICPSASFRQTGIFQSFPSSGVSAALADPLRKCCLEEPS